MTDTTHTDTHELADEDAPLADVQYNEYQYLDIPVEDIYESENMRTGALNITPLIGVIRANGLLHPVAVRATPDGAPHELPYELIAGYRRLAAYRALGIERVPASVLQANDEQAMVARITENIQREDPNAIDEARAMQQMIQVFGWTQTRVAKELNVVPSQVSKRLSLLSLPDSVIGMVAEGQLTGSHAEELTSLSTPRAQEEMAQIAIRSHANVGQLRKYVRRVQAEEEQYQQQTEQPALASAEGVSEPIVIPDQHTPLDMATPMMATPMPYLQLRPTLTEGMRARMLCYMLLRASNDVEALKYLEHTQGITRRTLWAWVMRQPQGEIERLVHVLVTRWFTAAHRFPTLSPDLVAGLGQVTDTSKDPLWGLPGHEDLLPPADA